MRGTWTTFEHRSLIRFRLRHLVSMVYVLRNIRGSRYGRRDSGRSESLRRLRRQRAGVEGAQQAVKFQAGREEVGGDRTEPEQAEQPERGVEGAKKESE